jgi:hypothetical protein
MELVGENSGLAGVTSRVNCWHDARRQVAFARLLLHVSASPPMISRFAIPEIASVHSVFVVAALVSERRDTYCQTLACYVAAQGSSVVDLPTTRITSSIGRTLWSTE